jgi:hypothetical protein
MADIGMGYGMQLVRRVSYERGEELANIWMGSGMQRVRRA